MLNQLKKFKVQSMLVLKRKKRYYHKIFHSTSKRIAKGSDLDVVLKSMYQGIMRKV